MVAITDGSGDLVDEQRYLPFGGLRVDPGITQTDFAFTGQRNLAAVGLMDYNARWYSQTVGVFTQPDSIIPSIIDPKNLNRYAYVNGNPLLLTDPTGRMPVECMINCSPHPQGPPITTSNPVYCDLHPDSTFCKYDPSQSPTGWYQGPPDDSWRGPRTEDIGHGYRGALPYDIREDYEERGADPELLDDVILVVEPEGFLDKLGCLLNPDSPAITFNNTVTFCSEENFGNNSYLAHELIHVRQNKENGWVKPTLNSFVDWIRENVDDDWSRYKDGGDPYEIEGYQCQASYDNNLSLDVSPCQTK